MEYGTPLIKSLNLIANRTENETLTKVIMDIGTTVETGGSFSEAAAKHHRHFPELIVNMFRAGEPDYPGHWGV